MSIDMNDVVKKLIENNQEPIVSLHSLSDETVLQQFIKLNQYYLMREFSEEFLPNFYHHLFYLLTVDCLIKIKKSTNVLETVSSFHTEYRYELAWDYEREKSIPYKSGLKVVQMELETPKKHNLLIKINNSFPLKGYLPELGEDFDYNQQFSAIKELVKDAYSMFVSEIQKTNKMPRIEFLVNRLIKEMGLELTDWGEVRKFANIVDISIDDLDFSAKIEKQFFSHNLPELGGAK